MINLRLLRDDDQYRLRAIAKGASPELIDELLTAERARLEALSVTESLRAESNAASKEIGRADPEERQAKIDAAGELKSRLTAATEELAVVEARARALAPDSQPGSRDGARRGRR